ncbi:MAG: hypothetical protein M3552_01055 [Planctomycetota bacterium]|nr:hypothetical protein [Planctomycetota bacterium]
MESRIQNARLRGYALTALLAAMAAAALAAAVILLFMPPRAGRQPALQDDAGGITTPLLSTWCTDPNDAYVNYQCCGRMPHSLKVTWCSGDEVVINYGSTLGYWIAEGDNLGTYVLSCNGDSKVVTKVTYSCDGNYWYLVLHLANEDGTSWGTTGWSKPTFVESCPPMWSNLYDGNPCCRADVTCVSI